MELYGYFAPGFTTAFIFTNLLYALPCSVTGTLICVLPGLAMLQPVTSGMEAPRANLITRII